MENEVHIFDDIIDLNYQEQIKTTLLENDFQWYYIHDVTNPYVNEQQRPGFQHNLVLEYGQENSPHHILFENLIKQRPKRKPIAYIIGKKEFWKYEFNITNKIKLK